MRTVEQTPTEAADYAVLTVAYGALLAGVAHASRGREPITNAELVPLGAATFALSKLIVHEKVETWLRRPFVEEPAEGRRRPRGRRLRYAVGELLDCTRCMGAWSALGLVALRTQSPAAARTVVAILAASAGNDLLQTGYSALCARANTEQTRAREAERGADLRAA